MNSALLYPSKGTLFSLTLTKAVSPIRRLAGLTSVETNAPAGGVAAACDVAGDGAARASKLSHTIEILMIFVDMVPPKSLFLYLDIYEYVCPNRAEMKVTCFDCFEVVKSKEELQTILQGRKKQKYCPPRVLVKVAWTH